MSVNIGQILRALRPIWGPLLGGMGVVLRRQLGMRANTAAIRHIGTLGRGSRVSPTPASVSAPDPRDARGFYPGDYRGLPMLNYSPHLNNSVPDSGEVVWAWVPYEENWTQGKDRPVLVIGIDNGWYLGLPLSSVDHDLDERQEEREGRYWVELGYGSWDTENRDSFVRVDRIVRLHPGTIRRIGGQITPDVWNKVTAGLRRHWND